MIEGKISAGCLKVDAELLGMAGNVAGTIPCFKRCLTVFSWFKNKTPLFAFLYGKILSNSKQISFLKVFCMLLFVLIPLCYCMDDWELWALNNTIFECRIAVKNTFQKYKATPVLFKKKKKCWALHSPKEVMFYRGTVPKNIPFVETPLFYPRIRMHLFTLARIIYSIPSVATFLCSILQEHQEMRNTFTAT